MPKFLIEQQTASQQPCGVGNLAPFCRQEDLGKERSYDCLSPHEESGPNPQTDLGVATLTVGHLATPWNPQTLS